jgi:2-oxoglutarate ferredoxin oxidoreductase subunit alpha
LEKKYTEDADIIVVSYGITSRVALQAVEQARAEGYRVGHLRLITMWPFPRDEIYDLSLDIKKYIVCEMNLGQVYHKILEYSGGNCEVDRYHKIGGEIPHPKEIFKMIKKR